jgi:hypothetical protein
VKRTQPGLGGRRLGVAVLEQALAGLGFEVGVTRDASLGALTRAVNAYARRLHAAGPGAGVIVRVSEPTDLARVSFVSDRQRDAFLGQRARCCGQHQSDQRGRHPSKAPHIPHISP